MTDLAAAAARLRERGIRRVESYAWRDLDDPEAGGSELHADEIFRRWAAAGVEIVHRTSTFDQPRVFDRNGYRVVQRGGRYDVFPRVALRQAVRRRPADTATIEIWNGVPWFAPVWAPSRRVVWMHHVHRDMWSEAVRAPLDSVGRFVETRVAPLFYRRSQFATLSESSAEEIAALGIDRSRLVVIPPGVHERFTPDERERAPRPHVVVVGRLAPVKRQRLALDALARARAAVGELTVDVIGDGPDRPRVEAWVAEHDAADWVRLRGRVGDDDLVAAYRQAWVVVSASYAEGWGMSLTEGAACGTPCVATDIAGHRGSALPGVTGELVAADAGDDALAAALGAAVADLLGDGDRRAAMRQAGLLHARGLSWSAVAARHLELLADQAGKSSSLLGNER
ncbi:MAG TPA: glycosyltransferase family 4 protein [Ilumatobacteraceae bacterium]|nr:glycosyltransferase family 4 protein [Ilumatobacteraceae bacterium]